MLSHPLYPHRTMSHSQRDLDFLGLFVFADAATSPRCSQSAVWDVNRIVSQSSLYPSTHAMSSRDRQYFPKPYKRPARDNSFQISANAAKCSRSGLNQPMQPLHTISHSQRKTVLTTHRQCVTIQGYRRVESAQTDRSSYTG